MAKKKQIQIIKIPLKSNNEDNKPQNFPRMPRLYLELIENKSKIKQDLINKEYNPPKIDNIDDFKSIEKASSSKSTRSYRKSHDKSRNTDDEADFNKSDNEKYDKHNDNQDNHSDHHSKHDDDYERDSEHERDRGSSRKKYDTDDSRSDISIDKEMMRNEDKSDDRSEDKSKDKSIDDDRTIDEDEERGNVSDDDKLSNRLKELLEDDEISNRDDREKRDSSNYYTANQEYSRDNRGDRGNRDNRGADKYSKCRNSPPTLAELEAQGVHKMKKELRNINNISESEIEEEDLKRELLFKYELLKKSYPTFNIPEYTIHSDFKTMRKSYDMTVKQVSIDSSFQTNRKYLIYGFAGIEFVLGKIFKLNMNGFASYQASNIVMYDKLLIELGEKSYIPTESSWPVEVRLIGMVIIQAVIFLFMKMIFDKTGTNILNILNNMNSTGSMPSQQPDKPKRKMREPNINISDIPTSTEINEAG